MRGFRKSSKAQGASRVEPRILRPMHYKRSAWDFLMHVIFGKGDGFYENHIKRRFRKGIRTGNERV